MRRRTRMMFVAGGLGLAMVASSLTATASAQEVRQLAATAEDGTALGNGLGLVTADDGSEASTFDYDQLRKMLDSGEVKDLAGGDEAAVKEFAAALDQIEQLGHDLDAGTAKLPDGVEAEKAAADEAAQGPSADELDAAVNEAMAKAKADTAKPQDSAAVAELPDPNGPDPSGSDLTPERVPADPAAPTDVRATFEQKEGWKDMAARMSMSSAPAAAAPPAKSGPVAKPNGTDGTNLLACRGLPWLGDFETADIAAPTDNTVFPGTLYSPTQDQFLSTTTPHVVYSGGGMQLRTVGGVQQFHVVGHLAERSLGFPLNAYRPVLKIADLRGNAWSFIAGSPDTDIKIKCYADDAGASGVTRGIVDAWLPLNGGGVNVAEPGFQVRFESVDSLTPNPIFFLGGDQRTAHVAAAPLTYRSVVPNALAVGADDGFMVDRNNDPNDDLEATATVAIDSAADQVVNGVVGTNLNLFGNGVSLQFHVNSAHVDHGVVKDIDLVPTWKNGSADDEYRLKVESRINGGKVEGNFRWRVRIRIFGWTIIITIPFCYAKMKFVADTRIQAAIDISPTNPAGLAGELETYSNIDVYNKLFLGGPLCMLANFVPNAVVNDIVGRMIEKKGTTTIDLGEQIANLVGNLRPVITLPSGTGILARVGSFIRTCVPFGCDGHMAGDVLMSADGLEAGVNATMTDTKRSTIFFPQARRFPRTHTPTLTNSATNIVRDHNNPPYDLAMAVSPTLLNQGLRSLTEGSRQNPNVGLLDLATPDLWAHPAVAPIFWEAPAAKRDLSMLLADYRFGTPDRRNSWAVNLYAGTDVDFSPATASLHSGLIATNPIVGVDIQVTSCSLVLYVLCSLIPALATTLVNTLGNQVLPQLIGNTVGTIQLPQLGQFDPLNVDVRRVDEHLVVYVDLGTARVWVNGGTGPTGFDFDALGELPGSGPVATTWSVNNDLFPGPVPFQTSPGIIGPTSHIHVNRADVTPVVLRFWIFRYELRVVTATVVGTRAGVSRTGTLQLARLDPI